MIANPIKIEFKTIFSEYAIKKLNKSIKKPNECLYSSFDHR